MLSVGSSPPIQRLLTFNIGDLKLRNRVSGAGFILFTKNIHAKLKQKLERFRLSLQPFSVLKSYIFKNEKIFVQVF